MREDLRLNFLGRKIAADRDDVFKRRYLIEVDGDNLPVRHIAQNLRPAPRRRTQIDNIVVAPYNLESVLDIQYFVSRT